MTSRGVSFNVKGKVYNACVQRVLMYDCEDGGNAALGKNRTYEGCVGWVSRTEYQVRSSMRDWVWRAWQILWGEVDWDRFDISNEKAVMIGCLLVDALRLHDQRTGAGAKRNGVSVSNRTCGLCTSRQTGQRTNAVTIIVQNRKSRFLGQNRTESKSWLSPPPIRFFAPFFHQRVQLFNTDKTSRKPSRLDTPKLQKIKSRDGNRPVFALFAINSGRAWCHISFEPLWISAKCFHHLVERFKLMKMSGHIWL